MTQPQRRSHIDTSIFNLDQVRGTEPGSLPTYFGELL